jgi:hypothetical protein
MKNLIILAVLFMSTSLLAGQAEFCAGFKEGYKAVKGDIAIVPICPIAPITPIGSNDYREGLKKGMAYAQAGM